MSLAVYDSSEFRHVALTVGVRSPEDLSPTSSFCAGPSPRLLIDGSICGSDPSFISAPSAVMLGVPTFSDASPVVGGWSADSA